MKNGNASTDNMALCGTFSIIIIIIYKNKKI